MEAVVLGGVEIGVVEMLGGVLGGEITGVGVLLGRGSIVVGEVGGEERGKGSSEDEDSCVAVALVLDRPTPFAGEAGEEAPVDSSDSFPGVAVVPVMGKDVGNFISSLSSCSSAELTVTWEDATNHISPPPN